MIASNAFEPIRDLFGGHSTESIQQRFRTIYSRAQESTTNQHHNINTPESTSLDLSTIDDILNKSNSDTLVGRPLDKLLIQTPLPKHYPIEETTSDDNIPTLAEALVEKHKSSTRRGTETGDRLYGYQPRCRYAGSRECHIGGTRRQRSVLPEQPSTGRCAPLACG